MTSICDMGESVRVLDLQFSALKLSLIVRIRPQLTRLLDSLAGASALV